MNSSKSCYGLLETACFDEIINMVDQILLTEAVDSVENVYYV